MIKMNDEVCIHCGCEIEGFGWSDDFDYDYIEVCSGCGQVEPETKPAEDDHECFICNFNGHG